VFNPLRKPTTRTKALSARAAECDPARAAMRSIPPKLSRLNYSWRGHSGAGRCGNVERKDQRQQLLYATKGRTMRSPRVRFSVQRMMVAMIFAAVLLGAFEAGRRWERVHHRRGALRVQTVRHPAPWELNKSASPAGTSPANDHAQQ
jgi:hypothetical protein